MQRKIGKILWWDRRDQEGLIVDGLGNQYFFNQSVSSKASVAKFKDGSYVEFLPALLDGNVSVGKDVIAINKTLTKRAEKKFDEQKQLSLGDF